MTEKTEVEDIMLKWFHEGKKLPRIPQGKTAASVAEIHRRRESGERPALTDDSPKSELTTRVNEAIARWKANRSL